MTFWDDRKNVNEYMEMARGFDGTELIEILRKHLTPGRTVLELGMGPGKDLDILGRTYQVTGSDHSQVFLDMYTETHKDVDLLKLDAVTLETDRTFDCIFSNKVLQHLTREELSTSFRNQLRLINEDSILFHALWYGDKEDEEFNGLLFVYYTEDTINEHIRDYELIEFKIYTEMEMNDSFYVILKKKRSGARKRCR